MTPVAVGRRAVGPDRVFIALEMGATHGGMVSIRRLLEAAAQAGVDGAKFQTIWARELMVREDGTQIAYTTPDGPSRESIWAALQRRELSESEWREVARMCTDLGLAFISTPSSRRGADLLASCGVAAIKIAKGDMTYLPLIEHVAQLGCPILLDGRERFQDVARAVKCCEAAGQRNLVLVHCPSGYPAELRGVHLRALAAIGALFEYPLGYADHSLGVALCYAAVGLGARYLEKTVTEDRHRDQVEHFMSLEPPEVGGFVQTVREIEAALGDPRVLLSSRVEPAHRRGAVARHPLVAGQTVEDSDIAWRRPAGGVEPPDWPSFRGRSLRWDVPAGQMLTPEDFA